MLRKNFVIPLDVPGRTLSDLPLVGVELGGNRFGGEERSAATGAPSSELHSVAPRRIAGGRRRPASILQGSRKNTNIHHRRQSSGESRLIARRAAMPQGCKFLRGPA